MFNKTWLCLGFMIIGLQSIVACDICGCNLGNHGIGLMNAFSANQLSVRYSLNSFNSSQQLANKVHDNFSSFELSLNYFLTKGLKLMAYLPYQVNQRQRNGKTQQIHGIGDSRVVVSQTVIDKFSLGENTSIHLEAGLGMNIPTGNYKENIHDQDLPENFNLGKGSWGINFQPQLVLNHKNVGLLWSANYLYQFKTASGYHYGNQFSTQLLFFYEKKFSDEIKWIPYAGLHSEWAQSDQYANDVLVHGTGAEAVYLATGMNFKYKSFMTGISLALPVSQNYSGGETIAKQKLSCQVFYFFN